MQKLAALLALTALLASPAAGFDTFWHSQCTQKVGEQFDFTDDSWRIMQLGDFSPDFFGPVSEHASPNFKGQELAVLNQYGMSNAQSRNAAIFLHLAKELETGMITEMSVSCAAGKWDGDNPPGDRGFLCNSMLARRLNSADNGNSIDSELIGLAASLLSPFALKFSGMLWDVHSQYHILENLADGIGSGSGRYGFAKQ